MKGSAKTFEMDFLNWKNVDEVIILYDLTTSIKFWPISVLRIKI